MTLKPAHVMSVLLERLNWPVRLVRWQAAKEAGALLSSEHRGLATSAYLEWLRTRKFEMEVVSGLAVLLCTTEKGLPSPEDVKASIRRPSILADFLFQRIYRKALGSAWVSANSGPAPLGFSADTYFEEHKGQVIPLILNSAFEQLERETGLPFLQQWAYEWRRVMDATDGSYSSFPYHFVDAGGSRSGIGGQFSQAQCTIYRSAYLRTLSFAVQRWGMPRNDALFTACKCLPLNRGLEGLKPIGRPQWLSNIPERCCKDDAPLEKLTRRLVKENIGTAGMRPVALRIPISTTVAQFGELSIEGCYATPDFAPDRASDSDGTFRRLLITGLPDLLSFEGPLRDRDADEYRLKVSRGSAIPVCLSVWPIPLGFWLNEYAHLGIQLPAPYNFAAVPEVKCTKGRVELTCKRTSVGHWRVWHDEWSPLQPSEGHTRCGSVTEMNSEALREASNTIGMPLAWNVELMLWKRPKEYGELQLEKRTAFFRD